MKIAVNFLPFGPLVGGAGRYAFNMLRSMAQAAPEDEFILIRRDSCASVDTFEYKNVRHIVRTVADKGASARIYEEQVQFPGLLRRNGADVLFAPSVSFPICSPVPVVATIHDVAYLHVPRKYPLVRRAYVKYLTALSARHAARVLTVSEFSKRELMETFGLSPDRISVTYNAVDPVFQRTPPSQDVSASLERLGVRLPYALFVGAVEPSKNIPVLFRAISQLKGAGTPVRLILTDTLGWSKRRVRTEHALRDIEDYVSFVRPESDEDLVRLYLGATVLLHPSQYEGFGLPVLEAMSVGIPVIAAPAEAVREIAGDAVLWADPFDADIWALQIRRCMSDRELCDRLRLGGRDRAKEFTWEKSALVALDACHEVATEASR